MLWENVRSSSVAFRICKMIVNFLKLILALIFWISKILPPCTIKNAKFHILDTMWKSFFFPTQTLYNTHQNILHNIHNLHEDRRKFRLTFKDDDNRRMPFRISSSKNDVLTKKKLSWSDLVCIYFHHFAKIRYA